MTPRWTVLVPVLDEAGVLPGLLDRLLPLRGRIDLIVVDGGSRDGSDAIAAMHPATPLLLRVDGGRHRQLNRGLDRARGDLVLCLSADARLSPAAWDALLGLGDGIGCAGCLRRRAADRSGVHRWLDGWAAVRARWTHGAYMDQGPVFRRAAALAAGGFRARGAYDTADLGRRLRAQGPFTVLPVPMVVSCREYRRSGFLRTTLRHQRRRTAHLLARV